MNSGVIRLIMGVLVFSALTAAAQAKIYYINKGVKYHIGDNKYDASEDKTFVGAYPVVGQQWIQAFSVDRVDKVKVRIEHIWGVDDCDYCKIIVSINEFDMGRLYRENNHTPFDTPTELAKEVKPGVVYYLKIESIGRDSVDDFVVENVLVETDAILTFLKPGPILKSPDQPMPKVEIPVVKAGPCDSLKVCDSWLYGQDIGKPAKFNLASTTVDFATSSVVARVALGTALEFAFKINQAPMRGELVEEPMEILLGDGQMSGWVLSYLPGRDEMGHGNIMKNDKYRKRAFKVNYVPGRWNTAKVALCGDGTARFFLNKTEVAQNVSGFTGEVPMIIRVMGLNADIAKNPE